MTRIALQKTLPALLIFFLFSVVMIVTAFSVHTSTVIPSTFCTHNPELCKKINDVKNETSIDTLYTFAKDEDENVRAAVAKNQNAPPILLRILSKDGNPHVRTSVVENGNTSISILHSLSVDKDHRVRLSIAKNLRTPMGVLFRLAYDEDAGISDIAINRIITKILILIPILPIFIISIFFSLFCKCIEISKRKKGEKTKMWTKMKRIMFAIAMITLLLMTIVYVRSVIGINSSFHP